MSYRTTNGEYGKQALQATNDSELPETGYVSIKHAMRELVNARRIPHEAVDMCRFTDLNPTNLLLRIRDLESFRRRRRHFIMKQELNLEADSFTELWRQIMGLRGQKVTSCLVGIFRRATSLAKVLLDYLTEASVRHSTQR